jgi:hypothetical protein
MSRYRREDEAFFLCRRSAGSRRGQPGDGLFIEGLDVHLPPRPVVQLPHGGALDDDHVGRQLHEVLRKSPKISRPGSGAIVNPKPTWEFPRLCGEAAKV